MSNEYFDDGLVHSHSAWCSERGAATHGERRDEAPAADAPPEPIEHDDGLVHGHGWARDDRRTAMVAAE